MKFVVANDGCSNVHVTRLLALLVCRCSSGSQQRLPSMWQQCQPLVLEKQRPVVWRWRALRCGNTFATQQRPSALLERAGIWTGPVNLGSCLKACQLSTQWRFPHWGVGDDLESLGNLPMCSERRKALTSLYWHWFTGIYGFFAILMSSDRAKSQRAKSK